MIRSFRQKWSWDKNWDKILIKPGGSMCNAATALGAVRWSYLIKNAPLHNWLLNTRGGWCLIFMRILSSVGFWYSSSHAGDGIRVSQCLGVQLPHWVSVRVSLHSQFPKSPPAFSQPLPAPPPPPLPHVLSGSSELSALLSSPGLQQYQSPLISSSLSSLYLQVFWCFFFIGGGRE